MIHSYVIKEECLWHMSLPSSSSWTIRKLFKLRVLVQPCIKYVVGNGARTFLWLDNWHPLGPLYFMFGDRVEFNMGRSLAAKVESLIRNNLWRWARRRNEVTKEIIEHTPSSLVPNSTQEDSVVWTLNCQGFSVKSAFEAVRNIHPTVGWWQVVWFKFHVPRWAIIQ